MRAARYRPASARRRGPIGSPIRLVLAGATAAVMLLAGCATAVTDEASGVTDEEGLPAADSRPDRDEPSHDPTPRKKSGHLLPDDHTAWDDEMADAMCFGNGLKARSSDAERARALMNGRLRLGSHQVTRVAAKPDWSANPFNDDNWESTLHKLTWADVLRREGLRTGNDAMLRRWETVLRDWTRRNPRGEAASEWAWTEVPTAQRALVFACAVAELGPEPWLRRAVREHGRALTDSDLRVKAGNHALLQDNGLLALGCLTGKRSWVRLAYRSNERLLQHAVDEQGVTAEGAIGYQNNNYRWWRRAASRVEKCGLPPWEHIDRLERMPLLMAHATLPGGTYAMIGDTGLRPAGPAADTVAEFAATQGESGPKPETLFRVFERGYAFGRSGWGAERPFGKETFFSLRFGMPLDAQVHGHKDHGSVTFASHGNRLLFDQGMYAFNGGSMRGYVRSPEAHNTVTVRGSPYDKEAPAELVHRENTETHILLTVRTVALDGTTWTRTLFYSKRGRYLLLDDRVDPAGDGNRASKAGTKRESPAPRTAVQRFHLADRTVRTAVGVDGTRAYTVGEGADVGLFWLVDPGLSWLGRAAPALHVAKGEKYPLLGWRSTEYGQAAPAPTLEARVSSAQPRFTTVVAPLPGKQGPGYVRVSDVDTSEDEVSATVRVGKVAERITVRPDGATVHAPDRGSLGP